VWSEGALEHSYHLPIQLLVLNNGLGESIASTRNAFDKRMGCSVADCKRKEASVVVGGGRANEVE
jgi:hypothetical protein